MKALRVKSYVDVPLQAFEVSQSSIEPETTVKGITKLVVVFYQTSYDITTTFKGYAPTYCELQVKN